MSKRTLAATCLLLILCSGLPAAGALPASASPGACLSAGDLPDRPPSVSIKCGPKVLLRLLTPAGSLALEVQVGPCDEGCAVLVIIELVLCSDPPRAPVSDPQSPIDGKWGPVVEGLLDSIEDMVERPVEGHPPVVVEMETALDCD